MTELKSAGSFGWVFHGRNAVEGIRSLIKECEALVISDDELGFIAFKTASASAGVGDSDELRRMWVNGDKSYWTKIATAVAAGVREVTDTNQAPFVMGLRKAGGFLNETVERQRAINIEHIQRNKQRVSIEQPYNREMSQTGHAYLKAPDEILVQALDEDHKTVILYLGKDKPGDRPGYAEEEALAEYESAAAWRVGLGRFQSVYVIGTNNVLLAGARRLSNAWLEKPIPEIGKTREVLDQFDPSGEAADTLLTPDKKTKRRKGKAKALPAPKTKATKVVTTKKKGKRTRSAGR